MREIVIHARAGQGAITTASILAQALFLEGKYAYAFPHFGAARMGAPMNAFLRFSDKPIRLRSRIYSPDYVIVVDSTLLRSIDVLKGLKEKGVIICDEREGIEYPSPQDKQHIYIVPATRIALEVMGKPLGNTALLGAFVGSTGIIKFSSLESAIKKRFSGKTGELNLECAKRGYEFIKKEEIKNES